MISMSGKELIQKALTLEPTSRVPWVPFIGIHGAKMIGKNATEYLKSADNIVNGISKAVEMYNPDGIPVMFDLQVEAEALGCQLIWTNNNPPAVHSHPLIQGVKLSSLAIPGPKEGRIGIAMEAARRLRKMHPDIALYGLITGPFTLALHLLGTDIFIKMYEDPEYIQHLLEFTKEVAKAMAGYYIENGCDVIAVVDPMTSQIDTALFRQFVFVPATEIFDFIRNKKVYSSFFVCGHAQQNIEIMCKCRPDNVSIDENIPLDFVKPIALEHKVSFGGNMKLTVVLLMGTPEDCMRDALECMDLGGDTGFILAPGCDLPMDTPIENLQSVTSIVHDPYRQNVIRTMEKTEADLELLNMKDYGKTDKVIVDIITLDSESCAPCQYMVESVKKVAPQFEGIVEWREHAIKRMEAVTFMASLMVKNIPTICIDGKIAFVSKIPPQHELVAAIQKRINEKLKHRIKSRKSEISILRKKSDDIHPLQENINLAIRETGKNITITVVDDERLIQEFGAYQTPAVLVTEFKLKSQGELPSVEVIKEWLKEL
jgi:MtaA/CmuA family methyltransferase